jgi:hypothetical protein
MVAWKKDAQSITLDSFVVNSTTRSLPSENVERRTRGANVFSGAHLELNGEINFFPIKSLSLTNDGGIDAEVHKAVAPIVCNNDNIVLLS